MAQYSKFLVLADDLTGALECGSKLAQCGLTAPVHTTPLIQVPPSAQGSTSHVINCSTRHRTAGVAREMVRSQARVFAGQEDFLIYKKTDSTLRGNIGAEMEALFDIYPHAPLLYVPAYPRLGRTCRDGILRVHGFPVAETAFGQDLFHPISDSAILNQLSHQTRVPALLLRKPEHLHPLLKVGAAGTILVCDAESDEEIAALAETALTISPPPLLAGPAAFLGAIIKAAGHLPVASPRLSPFQKSLWICGSRHPHSLAQLEKAAQTRRLVHSLAPFLVSSDEAFQIQQAAHSFARILLKQHQQDHFLIVGGPILKKEGQPLPQPDPGLSPLILRSLGAVAREVFNSWRIDLLSVWGGDTAGAVVEALEITSLHPLGELFEGIPFSTFQFQGRQIQLLTKAGAFGPENLVEMILQ
jgi:D-threonate/D-erythronate kinase